MKDIEPHWVGRSDYPNEPENEDAGCMYVFLGYVFAIIICAIITFCTGCSRVEYLEVPVTVHDTVNHTTLRIDSVYDRDSIYVEIAKLGDTIFNTKYIERWRTRKELVHDTLYIAHHDTVTIPKQVEKKLTKWQTYCLQLGNTIAIILLLAILYALYRAYKAVRRIFKRP